LDTDIARDPALQTGKVTAPYTNLMRAVVASRSLAAPFKANADGSVVTVRVSLLPGDHFVIEETIDWMAGKWPCCLIMIS